MDKNRVCRARIETVGSNGEGIAKVDNVAVFVPYAVVGDEADIRIVKVNKSYSFGKIENIIKPSPHRITPECGVFGRCGGCSLQSTDYETQLEIKRRRVADSLERIGGFRGVFVAPCEASLPNFHYRNKEQYPIASVDGRAAAGFYAPRSHRLIEAANCPLAKSDSGKIVSCVVDFLNEFGIAPYDEETKRGVVRHVYTRTGDEEIMTVIVTATDKLPRADELVKRLKSLSLDAELVGVVQSINTRGDNVILGESDKLLFGRDHIFDTLSGIKFKINYKSFYQVNKNTTERLYAKAMELLAPKTGETVLDLYCGIGTITLHAAKSASRAIGVEIVPEAIADARENAKINGISSAEFYVGAAEEVCQKLVSEGLSADAVIVDPPRKGCDEKLLETIVSLAPKRVVYVSCDPATLARDAKYLCENGYNLTEAYPFDQFPQTSHVETVVLMSRVKD